MNENPTIAEPVDPARRRPHGSHRPLDHASSAALLTAAPAAAAAPQPHRPRVRRRLRRHRSAVRHRPGAPAHPARRRDRLHRRRLRPRLPRRLDPHPDEPLVAAGRAAGARGHRAPVVRRRRHRHVRRPGAPARSTAPTPIPLRRAAPSRAPSSASSRCRRPCSSAACSVSSPRPGVNVPAVVVAAAMLAVLGIGLLVGAFRGRARWLIAPAVILLLVAQAIAFVPRVRQRHLGSRRGRPSLDPHDVGRASSSGGRGRARPDVAARPARRRRCHGRARPAHRRRPRRHHAGARRQRRTSATSTSRRVPTSRAPTLVEKTFPAIDSDGPTTTVTLTAEVGLGQLEVRRATS